MNWLNTSQGYRPAYNLTYTNGAWGMDLWPTSPDTNGNVAWTLGGTNLFRNANCTYFLPSENEWYKAAFGKNDGFGYYKYATASNLLPVGVSSGTNSGTVVINNDWSVGTASVFQAGGLSDYGTMGQTGNCFQWIETTSDGKNNTVDAPRFTGGMGYWYWISGGGYWDNGTSIISSSYFWSTDPLNKVYPYMSFRVASVDDSWLTNGLVAYYPFDGDFKDYSGNGNDATNHGALINSNGVAFNGTNSYLSYPVFGLTGARTYSAWVSSEGGIAILSQMKPFPASPHERWSFYATGNGLGLYYQLGYGGQYANGTYNKWFQQCLVDLHALNQCVAVLNPNDNNEEKVSLYLNGVYIGSVGDFIFSEMPTQYESGRELNSDIDIGYSSGIMKKLRIYNRALSSKEVAQLYALESTPPASFGPTNSQSISFPAIPTLTLTNGAYTLGATASSGLLVSYAIGDSTVAGITNGALIPLGVGTTTVVASQAGDTNYLPATPVTNTLVVTLAQQTVTPTSVATRTYGSLPFGLTLPTNASGLAITPRIVSGPATLSGMNIIITGTGTVSLAYDAPGNALYAPASVTNTFSVTNGPTNLKSQNITFKALAAKAYGSAPQALAGSASSKLR